MEVSFSYDRLGEGVYRLRVRHGAGLLVAINDEARLERLCNTLYDLHDGSCYGDTWKVVEAIVLSGINFIAWPSYMADLQQLYRADYPVALRELVAIGETPRKREWRVREEAIIRLKASRYIPDDVGLPDFLEGPPVDNSLLEAIQNEHGLSNETVFEYYAKSWRSRQFAQGEHFDFDYLSYTELQDIGLIRVGRDIPLVHLAHGLNANTLKSILKNLGLSHGPYRIENASVLANFARTEGVTTEELAPQLGEVANLHCILPPDGLDWEDFQSWRQQIKGMGELVINLWEGKVSRYPKDYAALTG